MTPFEKAARDHIASRVSKGTRELYTLDLERWLAFCVERKIDVAEPRPQQTAAFRDSLAMTQKPQTIRRTLASLSRMYRVAVAAWPRAAAWNPFDPDALARPPASDFSKTEAITDAEMRAIMLRVDSDTVHGACDRAIFQMLYDTGLRISAVVTLTRAKVFQRDGVTIARVRTKGKDEVEVELTAAATEALERWLAVAPQSPYVFPAARKPKQHVSRIVIYKRLRAHADAVGILHMHPHRFRAAFITSALDAGLALNDVQAAVHHSTPTMTQRYDRGVRGRGVSARVADFRRGKEED